ncbi:hypothetical protein SARC_08317 [Sphaeroforma arctica JP610]|uniref:Pinin/SDK/MemA protein domain-containing protein n=1 Tax=Sphaeroforma arctica JP610 TaxID=667725 RepID=A0A0L0FR89_9EUKA|nr:hypothetical protein SARC_08317 [Sphaeroforma arctica JP610]KNC79285.1 hypothetical protein SARC_08317 [Sphaeroforma arctica JP610]|eukprot:XP_014153187.1 hypothetical protein SARC_08317 [Sphaeroforma arctica JP610]
MVTMKEAESKFQAYKAELKEIEDQLHRFGATARRLQRKRQQRLEEDEEDDTPAIQSVIIRKTKSARVDPGDEQMHESPDKNFIGSNGSTDDTDVKADSKHNSKREDTHKGRSSGDHRREVERKESRGVHSNKDSDTRRRASAHAEHLPGEDSKKDVVDQEDVEEGELLDNVPEKPKSKGPILPKKEDMASISQARAQRISQGEAVLDKTRNRRLFGALMGNMGGGSRNRVVVGGRRVSKQKDEELIKKRQEIEKRITEKTSQQSKIEEEEILNLLQQKDETAQKLVNLSEEVEASRVQQMKFQHFTDLGSCEFIRVKSTPHIFYKPAKHTKTTLKLLERSRKAILAERPEDIRDATIIISDDRGEGEDDKMVTDDHCIKVERQHSPAGEEPSENKNRDRHEENEVVDFKMEEGTDMAADE